MDSTPTFQIHQRLPTVAEYQSLRRTTDWSPVEDPQVETALSNSLFGVIASRNGSIIGMGRIIGDGGLYLYIQDVIVHPDQQGKGIGRAIMNALETWLENNAPQGAFVGLMAAKGVYGFYERFGYLHRTADRPGMFKVIK